MNTKSFLRKEYLLKRKQLSERAFGQANLDILSQFKSIDLSGIKVIHLFLSITEKHEIDTQLIVDYLKQHHPHITIAVPQSNFSALTLTHFIIDDDLVIEKNKWNIPEPISGTQLSPKEIDMVLVPLLAVDSKGFRVGYGKGFYDRFLAECRPDIQKIGLSQFEPIEAIEDLNEFDLPLDVCLTPTKVIQF
ncbi:5-formyltetrahydrofolate cyclo-ligase [Solitalea sp. MAHUQ-68]|uniref:5-formyltetrahydrofolate cyclo-ligase n=1 Tax=Solitalea agri TaxID=2953739 RepID=A0A9X2JDD4_9SPHI|nr:5-formyltetrahydrofolate cyclo-ligase [Solitalea agri]MCO4292795.1 5-formyltetrahydrofolate cyclo-ligase [Solitalea agri]